MKVIETSFRGNRFYVRVENGEGTKTMPRANHEWLKSNPSFKEIPKGYVIHHLDGNQTNDDPTNLVLMQKFHHSAYHWKQKLVDVEVNLHDDFVELPFMKKAPRIKKKGEVYYLNTSSKNERHKIWRNQAGESMLTENDAKALAGQVFRNKGYRKTW